MTDEVTYASNRGDIAGRMKRWEPCYCGPEPKSYNNFDDWDNFFEDKPQTKYYKSSPTGALKEVNPKNFSTKIKKCLSGKSGKIAIFTGLALGAIATFAPKDKFCIVT